MVKHHPQSPVSEKQHETVEADSSDLRPLPVTVGSPSQPHGPVPAELQRVFARSPSLLPIQRSCRRTAATVAVSNSQLPW